MKVWMLDEPGQPLALREVTQPQPRRGAVLVRMESVPLLSYTRSYLEGKLPLPIRRDRSRQGPTASDGWRRSARASCRCGPVSAWP
jgi:hypothetical protein